MFGEKGFGSVPTEHSEHRAHARTFCDILQQRAAQAPQKEAFVFLDSQGAIAEEHTFASLDLRARAIAAELVDHGLNGERVLLVFPPGLDFVAALFACFYAGAVAVPVPFLPGKRVAERIGSICRDAIPAAVLTLRRLRDDPQLGEALYEVTDRFVSIHVDAIDPKRPAESLPMASPEAIALLQYTSGSTSSPKGVMLSHANLIANSAMIAEAFEHSETSRSVSWLPMFHDMGLVGHVLQPVYFGGLSVLMSPLAFLQRPARWLQAISTWKATLSGGPTSAFEQCLRAVRGDQLDGLDLSSWRVAYCGSERIRADVLERFTARFARNGFRQQSLLPCYGLAEATLLVTGARCETGLRIACPAKPSGHSGPAVSCGPPARGSVVVVVDPDTRAKLTDGAVGEIWVQGPHVGQGYWPGRANANETFRANMVDGSGPYLRTGDLGFAEAGQVFVIGRIKDTIIINGLTHSAEDIEAEVIRSHVLFAGLAAAAFAVDFGGQEQAVLVQEVRRAQTKRDELAEAVSRGFAAVTREQGVRLFDLMLVRAGSLPRTTSGKIRRSHARDAYLAHDFERLNPPGSLFADDVLFAPRRTGELNIA
jgi:acyl-CoA synthetase (AMP-forming)/AMP-acid ligase II